MWKKKCEFEKFWNRKSNKNVEKKIKKSDLIPYNNKLLFKNCEIFVNSVFEYLKRIEKPADRTLDYNEILEKWYIEYKIFQLKIGVNLETKSWNTLSKIFYYFWCFNKFVVPKFYSKIIVILVENLKEKII